MTNSITGLLNHIVEGKHLSETEMQHLMNQIMTGHVSEVMLSAILTALRMKGETIQEITGAAKAMRELSLKVDVDDIENLVDIVGTGGDGQHLFNVSTASSFVAASAGATVAKHGNRGVSSSSGSSDLLEKAGISLDLSIAETARCIREIGIGFLYAPNHHKAMKYAIGVRQELKMRSIFNLLGPLTNPSGVKSLVVGVFDKTLCNHVANVFKNLGAEHVMVVHSDDGLDEISIAAQTFVAELKDGNITNYIISPEDFGMQTQSLTGLQVSDKSESLKIITAALNKDKNKQQLVQPDIANKAAEMIALNAGAAIYVSGITHNLALGVNLAQKILASGQALEKLQNLAKFTKTIKETKPENQ